MVSLPEPEGSGGEFRGKRGNPKGGLASNAAWLGAGDAVAGKRIRRRFLSPFRVALTGSVSFVLFT